MKAPQCTTIVGVFEDRKRADEAIRALCQAGFRDDQIGVVMRHAEEIVEARANEEGSHAGQGAIAGVLTGLGLGALTGLGVLSGVIPVLGPAIAAGTLGVILSNAAVGAGVAGLVGALIGAGIPEEEARYYQGEFEAGRAIVTVNAEGRLNEATAILRRYGAYDMRTQVAVARETSGSTSAPFRPREGATIPPKAERSPAENKMIEVPVEHEDVVIERSPVHGRATAEGLSTDSMRQGEEIRIPVREEQVDVTKQAVQDSQRVSGQVRKGEVPLDKTGDIYVRPTGKNKPSK